MAAPRNKLVALPSSHLASGGLFLGRGQAEGQNERRGRRGGVPLFEAPVCSHQTGQTGEGEGGAVIYSSHPGALPHSTVLGPGHEMQDSQYS